MAREKVEIFHEHFTYTDEKENARYGVQQQYNKWMEDNGGKINVIDRQFHSSPGNVDITLYYSKKESEKTKKRDK
ncbi:hypothetical protein A2W54_04320 [Candidatus Giovannonibacteria bacterium RIFCSPHIGHO2_02_43_13]|uniref:GyrI-like small molecule binding domain-containing protein n=1 Tax=Candidatus Giovannonibacteria bacterium RIFCSPHIGHO2_02_43_13 TaxID=1798330 RepID=A0A1F5WQ07_9BACT|nr:MAG: hypothetical protein UW28_C0015G0006 [Parcubacteria group bacterium GW2011_GWA2_44_13]OGF74203.1 MAG: hypothetical protein A3E06_04410 [Candidatus Giovannonibacteria bacterium RIFCSPHIGHO2_12_FULL_44_42]OGF77710.1 MAG: hypothetical protein A2W54_04320 [Candidatus Giovannonibacteria bacterium RIFCSPHIGHO2_02_43_13]OGF88695.1 MAG: hypothetical protein A3I94_03835 [Candidatus Giovannonibacteria bacterium RIFCSPLOWO2_02_FULL_43_54]OGF96895.1 MAG: hypothetical protein A3H08_02565 [Candidatus